MTDHIIISGFIEKLYKQLFSRMMIIMILRKNGHVQKVDINLKG